MSDKDSNGFFGLIEENWKKVLLIGGITAGVVQVIPKVQENLQLYIFAFLGVVGIISFGACIYYAFFWQPKVKDRGTSSIIIPGVNNPVRRSQKQRGKQGKIVRWLARLGLLLIPLVFGSGFWWYQYQVQLPPTDFKILVADFESSDSSNYDVTQQIFSNLQTEMRDYGDKVKVEKLGKPLESIQEAKQAGKKEKAAIVIWGNYRVMNEVVPIRVNFEILHESSDYFKLGKSVQGDTQKAQISELESFELQTSLSQEMTYLSLFTLGMYRYLDDD
ncbi:MAG: hypothetical protein AAFR77_15105, partial [Cyanobacteria bacterium J06631_2]